MAKARTTAFFCKECGYDDRWGCDLEQSYIKQ